MKSKVYISAICALAINLAASDLGTIQVESSTIDDKFQAKMLEVSSTTTIQGEAIEDYHAENIADVLNNIPGVTVRKNEGDSNKIHIRGIASEVYMGESPGVVIVIDGVPVQERAGSVNIDSDNIESIKIIKGGASYLYGNDALAGAVIITTKRPKGKNEGFITTEAGTYGYQKHLARFMGSTEDMAVEIQGSYKASDGYWDNSDYWAQSFNGKFQYYIDDSSDITLGIDKSTRFENDTGAITHSTFDGTTYTNNIKTNPTSIGEVGFATNYDIDLTKLFLTYSKNFDNDSNLMTQLYQYGDITKNHSSPYDSDADGVKDDHQYDSYANTLQKGLKSEYRSGGDTIASMLGIDIAINEEARNTKYRVDITSGFPPVAHTIGEITADSDSKENINAIYGELKYQINNEITTSLNARLDQTTYDYTNNLTTQNWTKDFSEPSYRLGATYKLEEKSVLFASVSTGFRLPTLDQMYAGDMITSTFNGTYTNNTDIKTEKTYNYEIGYRNKNGIFSYEVSIYQLNRDDVIGKSSGNYATAKGVDVYWDNMADVQNMGLEFSFYSDKNKDFSFGFNYTYLDSKYTKYDEYNLILNEAGVDLNANGKTTDDYVEGVYNLADNTVPRTSKHTINLELNYKLIQDFIITAEVDYRSSQYADELNTIEVDGYSTVNLRANYKTKISKIDLEFFANIDNIFDEQYYMMPRATGDRNDDGIYDIRDMGLTVNPGITYLAGLSVKF